MEFLVILLDSLHEELNIRMKKPYIEKPSSNRREESELAVECWANFLHRNWSFIAFLFYGQMKSRLVCNICHNERISFDEFSTLSLPLPESSLINFKLIINLLPEEIKFLLNKTNNEDSLSLFNAREVKHKPR
jgi:ubiquitin C-terminal hydrolase